MFVNFKMLKCVVYKNINVYKCLLQVVPGLKLPQFNKWWTSKLHLVFFSSWCVLGVSFEGQLSGQGVGVYF